MEPTQMHKLFGNLPDPAFTIDCDGNVVYRNDAAAKVLSLAEDARIEQALGPDVTADVAAVRSGKADHVRFRMNVGGRSFSGTASAIAATPTEAAGTGAKGAKGATGAAARSCLILLHEVPELNGMSPAYEDLLGQLEAVVEASPDGIYITDGRGYTLRVNKAYERLTGLHRSDLIGRHMRDLVRLGYFSESATLKVLEQGKPVTIMQRIRDSKDLLVTGTPVRDEKGAITLVVTAVRDMTELTELQQEMQAVRALTDHYTEELRRLRLPGLGGHNLVVSSLAMKELTARVEQIAPFPTTVLLLGETGVGKEAVAALIHHCSNRAQKPFIKINCGAIPEHLLESELFGYVAGAFTGASKQGKPGMFELAHTGTLLLDEVADLPLAIQGKLLRALQEREITRLGDVRPRQVDVRIIAATNQDLETAVKNGDFREDLFYRLNVVTLHVPPLRERPEDTASLLDYFVEYFCTEYNLRRTLSPEVRQALLRHDWPGNIRELKNLVENLIVSAPQEVIGLADLPDRLTRLADGPSHAVRVHELVPLREGVAIVETRLLQMALDQYGSYRKAAEALEVDHSTVLRKAQRLGLSGAV